MEKILTEFYNLRKKLGLSQMQAAKILDRPKRTVQKWDRGENPAHKRELVNLQLRFDEQNKQK